MYLIKILHLKKILHKNLVNDFNFITKSMEN